MKTTYFHQSKCGTAAVYVSMFILVLFEMIRSQHVMASNHTDLGYAERAARDIKKNDAFRPAVTALTSYHAEAAESVRMGIHAELAPLVVNPKVNLPAKIAESATIRHKERKNPGERRYDVFHSTLSSDQKDYIANNQQYATQVDEAVSVYGYNFSRKLKQPFEQATAAENTVFILPANDSYRGEVFTPFTMNVAPVGEYGSAFGQRLALASRTLMEIALSDQMTTTLGNLPAMPSSIKLARNQDMEWERERYSDIQRTLVEGILSIYQSVALLSASRINTLNEQQLVTALLKPSVRNTNGLVAIFSRIAPGGFVGSMAERGLYVPEPLYSKDGVLRPSSSLLAAFAELKQYQVSIENNTRLGCPLARRGNDNNETSSVQLIADLFLTEYLATPTSLVTKNSQEVDINPDPAVALWTTANRTKEDTSNDNSQYQ